MTSYNSNTFQQLPYDNFCSIEMLKSLVENPIQLPNAMFRFMKNNFDASLENDFMVKYLQDVYNPPDNDLQLSRHKQFELQSMRIKDRHQPNVVIKESMKKIDMAWENERNIQINKLVDKNFSANTSRIIHRNFPEAISEYAMPKPNPLAFRYQNHSYNPMMAMNNKILHPKRRLEMNIYSDILKKKVKGNRDTTPKNISTKNVKYIEVIDDDVEIQPPTVKNKKKDKKLIQTKSLMRTGLKNTKTKKKTIEIIDSPDSTPKVTIMEEEKEGDRETTTNATNRTNIDEIIENEKDGMDGHQKEETFDFGDFNIDDLGIKILEEVFLCNKCQKQIPQKDTEKGYKEICQSCSKEKNRRVFSNKKNHNNKEEQKKPEQDIPFKTENKAEDKKTFDILAPIYHSRNFYEEGAKINIFESIQMQKMTPCGKYHQTALAPLDLYSKAHKKKLKKLWTPERLEYSLYEKFRNDVNGKNSVYLIDEEITEILVRHKYNIDQALIWSLKSNPEFQYYVKKSANRRRIMTKGVGRNYSNIYE